MTCLLKKRSKDEKPEEAKNKGLRGRSGKRLKGEKPRKRLLERRGKTENERLRERPKDEKPGKRLLERPGKTKSERLGERPKDEKPEKRLLERLGTNNARLRKRSEERLELDESSEVI